MSALEDGAMLEEGEKSLFQSCQEVSEADFRFVENCVAGEETKEEIRDILLERVAMKAWKIYQGRKMLN